MHLTPREKQVTALAIMGATNADIAAKLGCSYETVKHHLYTVFDKVGCTNRTELAYMLRDKINA